MRPWLSAQPRLHSEREPNSSESTRVDKPYSSSCRCSHVCKNLPCASLSFRCKSLFFIWGHSVPSETISWHFYSRHVGGTVGQQRRWQTACELNTGHSIRANSVKWKEGQVTELSWGGTLGTATWCSWELWSNWWGASIRRKRVLRSLMGWSEKVGHVELS